MHLCQPRPSYPPPLSHCLGGLVFKEKKKKIDSSSFLHIGFAIPVSESPAIIIFCVRDDRDPKPPAATVFVRPTESEGAKLELLETKQNKNIGRVLF